MTATPTAHPTVLQQGAQGPRIVELKRRLGIWGHRHPLPTPLAATPVFGTATVAAVEAFQHAAGLTPDGKVGDATWAALLAATGGNTRQSPALPGSFSHPEPPPYVSGSGAHGLQPWIAPQVDTICEHFGLQVSAGFGGHPPHDEHSDHGWGGAVDLAGAMSGMVACNLWADRYCSDPFRKGMVFRWVGGPAKDSNGVESGHTDHVHVSWYRSGPATTVFDLLEFA
jgi:hypothetical protein